MTITRMASALVLCAVSAGCSNMIYYYQTDKFSLGVEGRPDSTAPISGNFGFKQRIVTVVPSKDDKALFEGQPEEDAVSMVSYFDFKLKDADWTWLDPLTVNTALITGQAAAELSDDQAKGAFRALSTANLDVSRETWTAFGLIYDNRGSMPHTEELRELLDDLNEASAAILATAVPYPSYRRNEAVAPALPLVTERQFAIPAPEADVSDFDRLLVLHGDLLQSVENLEAWRTKDASSNGYRLKHDGTTSDGDDALTRDLKLELAAQRDQLTDIERDADVGSAIRGVIRKYTDFLHQ